MYDNLTGADSVKSTNKVSKHKDKIEFLTLAKNPAQQIDSILSNEKGQDKHVIKQEVSTSI